MSTVVALKIVYNDLNANINFCTVFNKHFTAPLPSTKYNCSLTYTTYHNTGSAELWLWYIIAPVKLIAAANTNTGIHQPCEAVTNSAVNGPHRIPGIVACKTMRVQYRCFNKLYNN